MYILYTDKNLSVLRFKSSYAFSKRQQNIELSDIFNIDIGLSDFHNCIWVVFKMYAPAIIKRRVNYNAW